MDQSLGQSKAMVHLKFLDHRIQNSDCPKDIYSEHIYQELLQYKSLDEDVDPKGEFDYYDDLKFLDLKDIRRSPAY